MNSSVVDLPFNKFVGLEQTTEEGKLLRLPGGGQYLMHLGTVHASALLALAEEWTASHAENGKSKALGASQVLPPVRPLPFGGRWSAGHPACHPADAGGL